MNESIVCAEFTKQSLYAKTLKAEPEQIALAPEHTALIVIDMQNAYTSEGGYLDLAGFDVSKTKPVVENIQKTITAAHAAGIQVIYFKNGWDFELIDALKPEPQDLVIEKPRYSGFFNTALDSMLRVRGIRNLVFVGIATNVCVESTLRDGFFLEYFGVALKDACYQAGPIEAQEASLYNIKTFFGWVSDTQSFVDTFETPSSQTLAKTA